jgi:hypothetical protein
MIRLQYLCTWGEPNRVGSLHMCPREQAEFTCFTMKVTCNVLMQRVWELSRRNESKQKVFSQAMSSQFIKLDGYNFSALECFHSWHSCYFWTRDVFICWNTLALDCWQMQGLSVDMWYFKISIAQDNLVCILLGSVASLVRGYLRFPGNLSWLQHWFTIIIHWNLTVTNCRSTLGLFLRESPAVTNYFL